jgi:glycosyltransferase involved in cell wall biosynthesis
MNKKIKVLVEANKAFSGDQDGTARYVTELLCAMRRLTEGDDVSWDIDVFLGEGLSFEIVAIRDFADKANGLFQPIEVGSRHGAIPYLQQFKQTCTRQLKHHLPEKLVHYLRFIKRTFYEFMLHHHPRFRFREYDLVHLTQPQSYLFFQNCATRMVTTVHDLTHLRYPQFHLKDNIANADSGMQLAVESDSEFIAVSNATRDDLLSYYPAIKPERIRVIREACDTNKFHPCNDPEAQARVRGKYGIPEGPYFLSLSTLEPRKNLLNSVKAFLLLLSERPELTINFVVAGKVGWMQEELLKMAEKHGDRLIFPGFIDDADLAALYSAAVAFSYVSFYEGFGLPPLEAMSCGVPVVYGDNSSMVEVVGKGGLPAAPSDVEDIKEKYKLLVLNRDTRDSTARIALERAQKFSWEVAARETLDLYKRVAGIVSGDCS